MQTQTNRKQQPILPLDYVEVRAAEMLRDPSDHEPQRRISGLLGPTAHDIATQPAVLAQVSKIKAGMDSSSRAERFLARTRGALQSIGSSAVREVLRDPNGPADRVVQLAHSEILEGQPDSQVVVGAAEAAMGLGPQLPNIPQDNIDTSVKE